MPKTQKPADCIKLEHSGIYAALFTNPKKNHRWEYILWFQDNERHSAQPLHTEEDIELCRTGVLAQPRDITHEHCAPEAAIELLKTYMRDIAVARLNGLRARIGRIDAEITHIETNLWAESALHDAMQNRPFQNPPADGSE